MGLDTRSPESVYTTRGNIVVPAQDPRPAATIRDIAATVHELDTTDQGAGLTHTRATNVITETYPTPAKSPT